MATYYISTDSGSFVQPEQFESLADALDDFGVPADVTDAESFEAWLERVGGYGFIEHNGERIADVPS